MSRELEEIRARIKGGWPIDDSVYTDRGTLLKWLDEARDAAVTLSLKLGTAETERDEARVDYARLAARYNEQAKAESEHCKDCCCARSWRALGIDDYTGKSIPEHIGALRAEIERLNMEMLAYRQKLTPADAKALLAVMDALYAEKHAAPRREGEHD